LLLRNSGLFSVSYIQLMSRCAGAGRKHTQTAKLANEILPYHGCYAQFMNEGWPEGQESSFMLFSGVSNILFFLGV